MCLFLSVDFASDFIRFKGMPLSTQSDGKSQRQHHDEFCELALIYNQSSNVAP